MASSTTVEFSLTTNATLLNDQIIDFISEHKIATHKAEFKPVGPSLPMMGFMTSPDRKRGYSIMFDGAGANRRVEWWVWDIENHKVINKQEFTFRGPPSDLA